MKKEIQKPEPQYTPGPWEASRISACDVALKGADGLWVGAVFLRPRTPRGANLRLIAAAPELAEALQQLLSSLVGQNIPIAARVRAYNKAEAALQKAGISTIPAGSEDNQ